MEYKVVTYNGKMIGNQGGVLMVEYDPLNPLKLPPLTIRVKCSPGSAAPIPYRMSNRTVTVVPVIGQADVYDITTSGTRGNDWQSLLSSGSSGSASCKNIIEVLGANPEGVSNMNHLFSKDTNLRSVAIFDTSSATNVSYMFNDCKSLIDLPETMDISNATYVSALFYNCEQLTHIPNLITRPNLTDISYMFSGCKNIETLPLIDTHSTTNISNFANGCKKLREIPLYDFSSVTDMSSAFSNCELLTTLPNTISTPSCTNYDSCFSGCSLLTHVSLGFFSGSDKRKNLETLFWNCYKLDNALTLYNSLNDGNSYNSSTFRNAGRDVEGGIEQLNQIPYTWGGLWNDIWIDFDFSDPTYDPSVHQLGVGKSVTGTDKYNQSSKNFSAVWEKLDGGTNMWRWKAMTGTDLSNAFVYGDGTGMGTPMLSNDTIITGIPSDLTYVEGGTIASLKSQAESWLVGHEIDPDDYVPECEIVDWKLEKATSISSFIGTNLWYNNCLTGELPKLESGSLGNISYAFDRCWNITAIPETIDLPSCTATQNAFYSMLSLDSLPSFVSFNGGQVDNTFKGCIMASKNSILLSYNMFKENNQISTHSNCYKQCGIKIDSTALDTIPTSWGGNLSDNSVIPIGTVLLKSNTVNYTNNDMIDLTDYYEVEDPAILPSETDMQYFVLDGITYYNSKAIEYIRNNISTIEPGCHLPTNAESTEIGDIILHNYDTSDWRDLEHRQQAELRDTFYADCIGYDEVENQYTSNDFTSCGYMMYPITNGTDISYTYVGYEGGSYGGYGPSTEDLDVNIYYPIYLVKD